MKAKTLRYVAGLVDMEIRHRAVAFMGRTRERWVVNSRCSAAWDAGAIGGFRAYFAGTPYYRVYADSSRDYSESEERGCRLGRDMAQRFEAAGGRWWPGERPTKAWGRE